MRLGWFIGNYIFAVLVGPRNLSLGHPNELKDTGLNQGGPELFRGGGLPGPCDLAGGGLNPG